MDRIGPTAMQWYMLMLHLGSKSYVSLGFRQVAYASIDPIGSRPFLLEPSSCKLLLLVVDSSKIHVVAEADGRYTKVRNTTPRWLFIICMYTSMSTRLPLYLSGHRNSNSFYSRGEAEFALKCVQPGLLCASSPHRLRAQEIWRTKVKSHHAILTISN